MLVAIVLWTFLPMLLLVTPHLEEQGTNDRCEWWLLALSEGQGGACSFLFPGDVNSPFCFSDSELTEGRLHYPIGKTCTLQSLCQDLWSQSGSRGKTEWVGSLLYLKFFSSFLLKSRYCVIIATWLLHIFLNWFRI